MPIILPEIIRKKNEIQCLFELKMKREEFLFTADLIVE